MKQPLIFAAIAWVVFVVEAARPALFPPGVLLLPVVVVGMLWCRSAVGIITGGVVLVLDGILHPQPLPVVPVLLTFAVTTLLSARTIDDAFDDHRSLRNRIPEWLQVILLTSFGLLLLAAAPVLIDKQPLAESWATLSQYIVIAIPASFLLVCLMQVGDEFGMRRTTSL